MAQENENSYHGYRYLLDAHNSRQYAVRFDNGKIAPPLLVFAQDPREDGFKPNETIFAFDDEIERKDTPNGARLSTQICRSTRTKPASRSAASASPSNMMSVSASTAATCASSTS